MGTRDKVALLGELQHLVVATWQLELLGLSRKAIARRAGQEGWRRWTPGIYLLPGPLTPVRRLAAALLPFTSRAGGITAVEAYREEHPGVPMVEALAHAAFRSGAVICGASAAWLHGLEKAPSTAWLRVPTHCGRTPRRATQLCHGTYAGRVCWIEGLPVVDVPQLLLDIAASPDQSPNHRHHRLTKLMSNADAKRLTTVDAVEDRLAEAGRVVGRPALSDACRDLRGELSHSDVEGAAREIVTRVLASFGLVLEPRPHPIELPGTVVAEADLAVLALLLDLEIDGPHHLLAAQREKDHARDRLARRARWTVERFSTEMVELRPKIFEAQVRDIVAHLLEQHSP